MKKIDTNQLRPYILTIQQKEIKKEYNFDNSFFTPPTVNNQKDMLVQLGMINHEFLEKRNYSHPEEK